jgi:hypothetical protein
MEVEMGKTMTVVEEWESHGRRCRISEAPFSGCFNGYVQAPETLWKVSYDDIPVEVHGGLTYGPDDEGFVGFDTLHAGDFWPDGDPRIMHPERDDPYRRTWTMEALRKEVESLAEQLSRLDGC